MKDLKNFISENKEYKMPKLNIKYEYKQDELLGEVEEYFSASDDWDDETLEKTKKILNKIPSNTMFGYISSEDDNEDEDLIFNINDVIQFNKNIKNLGKVETDMPSLGLYQLNSIYILRLNSEQDIEYFISK
jgi:hypothetical protein